MSISPPPAATPRFTPNVRLMRTARILPVFLPFEGCPGRCVFCDQQRQTGDHSAEVNLAEARRRLAALPSSGPAWELAFYGGTFTSLPKSLFEDCLSLLRLHRNVVSHARCSTRPDAVPGATLRHLKDTGIDLVELGVQSFDSRALSLAGRGYDRDIALAGCRAVTEEGLALGIQLLPGMPGVDADIFLHDVRQALALEPACLRFYPCLVPAATPLAAWWKSGRYTPWSLEETVRTLAEGLRLAWEAGVPVIRLALAPEASFDAHVLAGPRHPALGMLIQAEALRLTVEARLGLMPNATRLHLPRACQGYAYGEHGQLKEWWQQKGLRLVFHDNAEAWLE